MYAKAFCIHQMRPVVAICFAIVCLLAAVFFFYDAGWIAFWRAAGNFAFVPVIGFPVAAAIGAAIRRKRHPACEISDDAPKMQEGAKA